MLKITVGGKSIGPDQFADEMMKQLFTKVVDELREKYSAVRHPKTGEFPAVIVLGTSMDDFSLRLEGSCELLAMVRERFSSEDLDGVELYATDVAKTAPKVFLSYAGEDREDAEKIAKTLIAQGIDTWWAEWSLSAGDSLRQKIDEGLTDCTHFIVLLTPTSINKPWVKTEIDAGFVGKVEARCRFIPLRKNLSVEALTPLLRSLVTPTIDDFDKSIPQLISDIHGLTKKPPLGPAPKVEQQNESYSHAANTIAKYFVTKTETARFADPQITINDLAQELSLTEEDVRDGLHELRSFFRKIQFDRVMPEPTLFVEFDKNFTEHDPAQDGLKLALDIMNDPEFPSHTGKIAEQYGWSARRLNPAISYLIQRDLLNDRRVLASGPWITVSVDPKPDPLRRFVKSRS